jgi:hypothetical protein
MGHSGGSGVAGSNREGKEILLMDFRWVVGWRQANGGRQMANDEGPMTNAGWRSAECQVPSTKY